MSELLKATLYNRVYLCIKSKSRIKDNLKMFCTDTEIRKRQAQVVTDTLSTLKSTLISSKKDHLQLTFVKLKVIFKKILILPYEFKKVFRE